MTTNTITNAFVDVGEANQHVKWAFSRMRYITATIRDMLKRDEVWPDLAQEIYAAAYECYKRNLDAQQTRNLTQSRIRFFFKNYGYREHRFTVFKQEVPFSVFSSQFHDDGDVYEYIMENVRTKHSKREHDPDSCTLRHMEEKIFATLRRHPQGVNRYIMSRRLGLEVQETQHYLDKLIAENRIVCVERDNCKGTRVSSRISPIYFVAGGEIPQRSIRNEVAEAIRHAYFVEHKTRHQIHKETGRNYWTILRAVATVSAELIGSK